MFSRRRRLGWSGGVTTRLVSQGARGSGLPCQRGVATLNRLARWVSVAGCAAARALSLVWLLAAAAQCGSNVPPCYGVNTGDKIAVTVVDSYDGNSNYAHVGPVYDHCDFGFDLSQGQVLQTTVVGTAANDDVCTVAMVTVAPFANWTWTPA